MTDFYASWTDSDPHYHDFLSSCPILVSPHNVPKNWKDFRFSRLPEKLIIDSGGFSLMEGSLQQASQKTVFRKQLELVAGFPGEVSLCHLDHPIEPGMFSPIERFKRIERTIANAHDFMKFFKRANLPGNIRSLGVVQGYDSDSLAFCAKEMKRLDFDCYGVGSLAKLYRNDLILERVETVQKFVGPKVHVFGISSIPLLKSLIKSGIASFDSSRHMKMAIFNRIIYSRPFRRYAIAGTSSVQSGIQVLKRPLFCDCPICRVNPELIFRVGTKRGINLRGIHNLYHMQRELEPILKVFSLDIPG